MASVECSCGAVKINFTSPKVLWRLDCCCYNCTKALNYVKNKGGPDVAGLDLQCIDSVWFQNDFTVEKGEDKIGAWLCYEGADTTRFYCKNCWTCLLADHPAYGGVVCASQAMANLSGAELMDKQGRHYMRDLSDDQATALEKGMPWKGDSANLYQGVSQNFLDKLPDVLAAGKKGEKMNCQILLEKCGPALIPTDDPTLRGPPSFMEQVAAEKK